jgi:hypothetical protein
VKNFAAGRICIGKYHAYTCLAWDSGFEFVFPTGIVRWSTLHNKHIINLSKTSKNNLITKFQPSYFKIRKNLNKGSNWAANSHTVEIFWYENREKALKAEIEELDSQRKIYDWMQWSEY